MMHYFCDELIVPYMKKAKIGEYQCLLKESFYELHDRSSLGKVAAPPPPSQLIPAHAPAADSTNSQWIGRRISNSLFLTAD